MEDGVYEVDLPYKKNKGLVEIDRLNQLIVSTDPISNQVIIHELQTNVIKKFNSKATSLEVNRLVCLWIPVGMIGVLVATFFIREPYRYMAICFGLFLIPIYPIYVCLKKQNKDRIINRFINSVSDKTQDMVNAKRLNKSRFLQSALGQRTYKDFSGFGIYVTEFPSERRINRFARQSAFRPPGRNLNRRNTMKKKKNLSNNTTSHSMNPNRQETPPQKRPSFSMEPMIKSKSIQPPPKKPVARPQSQYSIHMEQNFPSNINTNRSNLPIPPLVPVDTDSENEGSSQQKKKDNISTKNVEKIASKFENKEKGTSEFQEDPKETWVDYKKNGKLPEQGETEK